MTMLLQIGHAAASSRTGLGRTGPNSPHGIQKRLSSTFAVRCPVSLSRTFLICEDGSRRQFRSLLYLNTIPPHPARPHSSRLLAAQPR